MIVIPINLASIEWIDRWVPWYHALHDYRDAVGPSQPYPYLYPGEPVTIVAEAEAGWAQVCR